MVETITTCDRCGHKRSSLDELKERFYVITININCGYGDSTRASALWCEGCIDKAFGPQTKKTEDKSTPTETASEKLARLIGEIAGEAVADTVEQAINRR